MIPESGRAPRSHRGMTAIAHEWSCAVKCGWVNGNDREKVGVCATYLIRVVAKAIVVSPPSRLLHLLCGVF
jgi:hypothetical protein